jgi:CRISPR-associated protein Cmr4
MTNTLYKINCSTNLHVGSGDSNYGIIDNLVQRDVLTKLPMINESSLKGSIKEFFVDKVRVEKNLSSKEAKKDPRIKTIFGNNDGQGDYKFYAGHLLLFPVRTNKTPYLLATCPKVLEEFCAIAKIMDFDVKALQLFMNLPVAPKQPLVFDDSLNGVLIEYPDFVAKKTSGKVPEFLGDNASIILMADDDFKMVCGENKLPVIARNHLEDGRSTNLWYEEIVPRKSVFYCFVGEVENERSFFSDNMKKPIQIGANASIGYGLVSFEKIEKI